MVSAGLMHGLCWSMMVSTGLMVSAGLCSLAITFAPHKFVQIAGKLMPVTAFHTFEFSLNSVPVRFNILSVTSSDLIHEVK